MSQYAINVDVMLFESGVLADALSDKTQGQDLATEIEQQCESAASSGQISFSLTLEPFEAGMAINALTKGSSQLGQSLGQKFEQALEGVLQANNIQYGSNSGSAPQPLGAEDTDPNASPQPMGAEDSNPNASAQPASPSTGNGNSSDQSNEATADQGSAPNL